MLHYSRVLRILTLNIATKRCWQTVMICSLVALTQEHVLVLEHAKFLIRIHGDQSHLVGVHLEQCDWMLATCNL